MPQISAFFMTLLVQLLWPHISLATYFSFLYDIIGTGTVAAYFRLLMMPLVQVLWPHTSDFFMTLLVVVQTARYNMAALTVMFLQLSNVSKFQSY